MMMHIHTHAMTRTLRRVCARLMRLCVLGASAVAFAQPAPLALRWEVLRTVADAEGARSEVAMTLTNQGSEPLAGQGWSLYFTAIAGVQTGPVLEGGGELERVSGTLFRLRPAAAQTAVLPGASVRWVFRHPEVMLMPAKAPQTPYIAFDAKPDSARLLRDYRIEPLTRAAQRDLGPVDREPLVTPQALYARYAKAVDLPVSALPPVFPTPQQVQPQAGSLLWNAMPRVVADARLKAEVVLAGRILSRYWPGVAPGQGSGAPLHLGLKKADDAKSAEAYELVVDASGVSITAAHAAGISRGLQSLRDLLPVAVTGAGKVGLPHMVLRDAPRFEYRGVMLDVSRNFQSRDTVLGVLDLMARYKLNKLHLHLTDDEGWRLEIPGLPELTRYGARRGHPADLREHLPSAYGSGPAVDDPHGSGYFSRADYVAIVRHAAALHIEVIPEIEMPGHARAAVKAMEYRSRERRRLGQGGADDYLLSDPQDKSQYRSPQLYTDHVINPALPGTYRFIDKVVGELVRLHRLAGAPLRSVHVGADEVPKGAWEKSPAVDALKKKHGLADTAAVWDHFYNQVGGILQRHGVAAAGWEELGTRTTELRGQRRVIPNPEFLRRGFTAFVWNNLDDDVDLAYRLANAGYATVLAPVTNLYFDMAHLKSDAEQGHNWGAYVDLDTVFDFVPLDFVRRSPTDASPVPGREALTAYGQRQIRGIEATLFSETMRTPERLQHMLMPRLLALAERAWAQDPAWTREKDKTQADKLHAADWSVFANTLGKRVLPRLDAERAGGAYRIAPPGLKLENGQVWVNHALPGTTLRYTTDGSLPNALSPRVSGPLPATVALRVAAFDGNGRASRTTDFPTPSQ